MRIFGPSDGHKKRRQGPGNFGKRAPVNIGCSRAKWKCRFITFTKGRQLLEQQRARLARFESGTEGAVMAARILKGLEETVASFESHLKLAEASEGPLIPGLAHVSAGTRQQPH